MKKKRAILIGIGVLAIAFILVSWIEHERLKADLKRYKDSLIAQGETFSVEALLPRYPGETNNGLAALTNAIESLPDINGPGYDIPPPPSMQIVAPGKGRVTWREEYLEVEPWMNERWHTNLWDEISPMIEPSREIIAKIHEAAAMKYLAGRLNYTNGQIGGGTTWGTLRKPADYFSATIPYDLRHGNPSDAYNHCLTLVRLTRASSQAPTTLSFLSRTVSMYLIYPMQWEALQYPEWTDAQLGQWQTEWEQVRFIAPRSTELRLNIAMISNQYTKLRGSIRDLIGLTKHAITGWNMSSKSMWDFIKAEPVSAA